MKAFRMHRVTTASIDQVEDPTPKPGEVIVEPSISGLCATDVHIFFDNALVQEEHLPITMGHETVGRIADTGLDGAAWAPYAARPKPASAGDLVCVEPVFPCGACAQCLRGRQNLCQRMSHLGIWRDGCWAEYVAVPALRAIPLPEGMSLDEAIFVEPLACGLNFLEKANIYPGQSMLIVGAGPAGLLTLQAAKAAGADPVIVSDPAPARRAMAKRVGADVVVDPASEDLAQIIADHTDGIGADVVIEISGASNGVAQAIEIARAGSTVVLAGICGQHHTPIDTNSIVTRELRVVGAVASIWHFDRAIKLISSGAIDVRPLISRKVHWTDVREQLDVARHDQDVVKILLDH